MFAVVKGSLSQSSFWVVIRPIKFSITNRFSISIIGCYVQNTCSFFNATTFSLTCENQTVTLNRFHRILLPYNVVAVPAAASMYRSHREVSEGGDDGTDGNIDGDESSDAEEKSFCCILMSGMRGRCFPWRRGGLGLSSSLLNSRLCKLKTILKASERIYN